MLTVTAETAAEASAVGGEHPLHIKHGLKFCGYEVLPAFVVADYGLTFNQLNELRPALADHVHRHFGRPGRRAVLIPC